MTEPSKTTWYLQDGTEVSCDPSLGGDHAPGQLTSIDDRPRTVIILEWVARIVIGSICLAIGGLWMWFFGGLFRETDDRTIRVVIVALEPIGTLALMAGAALLFPDLDLGNRLARYYRFVIVVLIGWIIAGVGIVLYVLT